MQLRAMKIKRKKNSRVQPALNCHRLWLASSCSLAFHAFLFWCLTQESFFKTEPVPLPHQSVTVSIIDNDESEKAKPRAQSPGRSQSLPGKRTLKLRDLQPSYPAFGSSVEPLFNEETIEFGQYDKYSENGAIGQMNALGLEEFSAMTPFFEAIWKRIDSRLDYPEDFLKQNITGQVNIHVLVDARGVMLNRALEVTGSDPFLESYTLVLLLHALSKPLAQQYWLKEKKNMAITLTFEFDTHSVPYKVTEKGSHYKNALYFKRHRYAHPVIMKKFEKFYSRYMPPIIPVPGGFFIDFVQAYRWVERIRKPHMDFDEDKNINERLNNFRKQLDLIIKKHKSTES